MNIKTNYDPPPIPIRDFDWTAYDDATYDEGAPLGHGKTEAEAIEDLMNQIDEKEAA